MQSCANASPMMRRGFQTNLKRAAEPRIIKRCEESKNDALKLKSDPRMESGHAAANGLDSSTEIFAATLNNVGTLYREQSEMQLALHWYRKGTLSLAKSLEGNKISNFRQYYVIALDKEKELMSTTMTDDKRNGDNLHLLYLFGTDVESSSLSSDAMMINKSAPLDVQMVSTILFYNMAMIHYLQGQLDNSLWLFETSLAAIDQTTSSGANLAATIHQNMGQIYCQQSQWEKGMKHFNKSAAIDDQQLSDATAQQLPRHATSGIQDRLTNTLSRIGHLHFAAGKYSKAMDYCNDVLSIQMDYLAFNDIKIAATFYNVSKILQEQGELSSALSYCSWFVRHASSRFGCLHPQVLKALHNVGEMQHQIGQYAEARKTLTKCFARRRKSNDFLPHRDTAATLMSLAQVNQDIGLHSTALDEYQEAMRILSKLPDDFLEDKAAIFWNIAQTHQLQNEPDKALEAYKQILGIVRSIEIDDDSYARLHISIGNIFLERGCLSEAMSSFATAERVTPSIERIENSFVDSISIYMSSLLFAHTHCAASAA